MQNIILTLIMTILLVPGSVFAATGASGSVETLSATIIDEHTTEMRASVMGNTQDAKLFFEYGPTQELGRRTSTVSAPMSGKVVRYQRAFFLTPHVTYYYRAVVEGVNGTTNGDIRTFVSGYPDDSQYVNGGKTENTNQNNTTLGTAFSGGSGVTGSTNGTNGSNANGNTSNTNGTGNSGANTNQVASVFSAFGASGSQNGSASVLNPGGFFQRLFDSFTRARPLQLSVAMKPEKPAAREIIEYVITYTNDSNQAVGAGTMTIVIPDSVVYLADNSGGKTTLAKVAGGQELTLATDALAAKEKRTLTVMAVAGSGVASAVPTAIASVSYMNAQGTVQNITTNTTNKATPLVATTKSVTSQQANVADVSTNGSILPNTFFEWLIFLAVVTGLIVVVRKVAAIYQERKKRILEESQPGKPAHA